jgi:hypothetical protein
MRLTKFAVIWLAVVTAAPAQGPEPSRAGARGKDDRRETGGEALARWQMGVELAPLLGD